MVNKPFKYKVNLVPLNIPNAEPNSFRDKLNAIPYLLYEVEQISNGNKVVINKPGGKRSFGRLSRNDLMVFIYNPEDEILWLISHSEIFNDLLLKKADDEASAMNLVRGLFAVCCGDDPMITIDVLGLRDTVGLPVETILKVYKWIWGQEDCNYPNQKGRWLSMDAILEQFDMTHDDFER